MKLGYWDLRGRAGCPRLMLAYRGIEYENVTYTLDKSDMSQCQWFKEKETLGLAFPNLPYLMDDDVKLTESGAINRYLARKLDLKPINDNEEMDCDMVAGVLEGMLMAFATLAYSEDMVEKLDEKKASFSNTLKMINKFLEGRDFVSGSTLTYVDFALYEMVDWHRLLFPDILNDLGNINRFIVRFESLERIAAFINSKSYKKFPIFSSFATWGGKDHDDRTW